MTEPREGVRALMTSYLDNAAISRVKVVPSRRIDSVARTGTTLSLSVAMFLAVDDAVVAPGTVDTAVGDLRAVPDLAALATIDAESGLAWAPADLRTLDGEPHPGCTRAPLKEIERLAAEAGFEFLVGIEMEFTLFAGDETAHHGPGYGTRPFFEFERWHFDLLDAMETAGVPVEQIHPEYEAGQFELSFAPRSPVRAVDDYVLARHIVTRVTERHGLRVSFQPVPVAGRVGNGAHVHFSATRDGVNVFHDPAGAHGIGKDGQRMIAGVLHRLHETTALLGGSTLSFERLRPHSWSGAAIAWGIANREVAIRLMRGYAGQEARQSNVEVKSIDPAANTYLAVATVLAAALEGVRDEAVLPEPAPATPDAMSEEERVRAGMTAFPASLAEALDLLASSEFARRIFGSFLLDGYLAVRRHDAEVFAQTPIQEVAEALRFRL